MSEPYTLGDALPLEIKRCEELIEQYKFIGPAGTFGAAMIRRDIQNAQNAIMNGDTVAMIRAFQTLKNCQ